MPGRTAAIAAAVSLTDKFLLEFCFLSVYVFFYFPHDGSIPTICLENSRHLAAYIIHFGIAVLFHRRQNICFQERPVLSKSGCADLLGKQHTLMCLPDDLQQLPFIALLLLVQLRYQRFDLRVAFVLLWMRSSSGCALALRYNRTGDRSRAGICTGSPLRTG